MSTTNYHNFNSQICELQKQFKQRISKLEQKRNYFNDLKNTELREYSPILNFKYDYARNFCSVLPNHLCLAFIVLSWLVDFGFIQKHFSKLIMNFLDTQTENIFNLSNQNIDNLELVKDSLFKAKDLPILDVEIIN